MFTRDKTTPQADAVLRQAANASAVHTPPTQTPSAAAPSGTTINLSKPLVTHRGPINEIVVREPTFAEFIDYGPINSVVFTQDELTGRATQLEGKIDRNSLMRWMVALTGLDRIVLGNLSPRDSFLVSDVIAKSVRRFTDADAKEGN